MSHPVLRVQLFGDFHLTYDNRPVAGVHSARLQSLLTYLIVHADAPQLRPRVAFVLWPDAPESHALNNLRQFLYQLRHALPTAARFLVIDANTVYWQTDEAQEIDVQRFRHLLYEADRAAAQGAATAVRSCLEQAASIYQGDLLPGCYDEWIVSEREHLRQQYSSACQRLIGVLESQRAYAPALQVAQQLLRLDPLDESVYVALLRLHSLNEDRTGALRTYQSAVEILRRELDVEPSTALRSAYEQLQRAARVTPPFEAATISNGESGSLIGRQVEWQQLQTIWQHTVEGGAQFALITGEAGIGKSRLAQELFQWAMRQGFTTAHTRAYGAEGRLSLAPVTEWLRSSAVQSSLAALDPIWLTEIARLLPEVLNNHPTLAQPEPITEYGRRQRFFEALARGVLAAPAPLLLWVDDLHWCDQETLEWLHFLLRFAARRPLLMLGAARSEASPPEHPLSALTRQLRAEVGVSVIELAPLNAAETATLAAQVQGYALDSAASMRLYRETEGNPLFVVETIRASMAHSAAAAAAPDAAAADADPTILPPRVQAVIVERLAQLSPTARKVVQVGAVIGRAFALELLLLTAHEDEETVIHALDELWQRRIVHEQAANLFDFTHDKLREVAYAETSVPQRRLLHRRTAQALEQLNAARLDPISAQVAAHYEQAGLVEQAIPYYQHAGSVAAGVYANDSAIELFTRGLALLAQLPPGTLRDAQELNLQLALAPLYRITKGWASLEVEQCLNRALILSNTVGNASHRVQALYGLQSLNVVAARLEKVQYPYPEMDKLFRQIQDNPPPFAGLMYTGAKLHMGRLVEAREQFERIVAERDSRHIRDLQESQGVNYLVLGCAWNSHALWCLGYADSAHASARNAIALARELEQPFNHALAVTYGATLQAWSANAETFFAHAQDAYTLTREYQVTYYHAWASILFHFAQVWRQPDAEGLTQLRSTIHRFMKMGSRLRLPLYFSLLARACFKAKRPDEGLEALELALAESLQNNEHWWDAEIHRLRGELMGAQGADPGDIEAAFQRACEIARTQQARSLELRAATSLARFWQATSRQAEAKQQLSQLYAWFTEGMATPDLQAARALLAQL
ncbi:MAG: AAA family ATPase [Caldilineaceae bacterium]|nr:AAA family ATPase [Caldilineaceae bacterium]